jgi:hypothetical protein
VTRLRRSRPARRFFLDVEEILRLAPGAAGITIAAAILWRCATY